MQSPAVRMPEPEPEAKVDDEDTLSGLDPVPAVDTAVISADTVEEQLQQLEPEPEPEPVAAPAPATPAKPRRRFGPLIALVLLLAAIGVLLYWGLTR